MKQLLALAVVVGVSACAHKQPVQEPMQVAPAAQPSAGPGTPPPPVGFQSPESDIAVWNTQHPEAAHALCAWVSGHRAAAQRFFEWDANHPERSREFVVWAIYHPRQNIDAFVATHPNWPGFSRIVENHRPAAMTFMDWARRFPTAAERLMNHRSGLAWAGSHLGC